MNTLFILFYLSTYILPFSIEAFLNQLNITSMWSSILIRIETLVDGDKKMTMQGRAEVTIDWLNINVS